MKVISYFNFYLKHNTLLYLNISTKTFPKFNVKIKYYILSIAISILLPFAFY